MFRRYATLPRTVLVLCLGTLINRAGSFVVLYLTIYAKKELGFRDSVATQCLGAFGLGSMAAALTGGHLADLIGRRPVILASLFGGAGLILLLGFSRSQPAFLATVFGFALVADMYRPAVAAAIGDVVEPARRPLAFSLMYLAINLGFTIGAAGGGMIAKLSFRWLFIADAATTFACACIFLFAVPETRPRLLVPRPAPPAASLDGAAGADAPASGIEPRPRSWLVLADGTFLVLCASWFLNSLVFQQGFSTLPLYLDSRGIDQATFGRLIAINGVLIVVLQLPLTILLARRDRLRVISWGFALVGAGYGLNGISNGVAGHAASIVVWTLGEILIASFLSATVTDLAPVAVRSRYHGALATCYSLAVAAGAPLGGLMLEKLGGGALWASCVVISLAAIVLLELAAGSIRRRLARPSVGAGAADGESGQRAGA